MQPSSSLFTPLKTKRIFEEISDQIRGLIYSGVFKLGDKLPSERELADQFKAGRMVVREAFRTLEQSGLIEIKQGSLGGAFIKNASPKVITRSLWDMVNIGNITLKDLTEARLGIEKIILEFAIVRINNEELDLLWKNIKDTEELAAKGIRVVKNNLNFHLLLARFSKNPLFQMIAESIMNVMESFLLSLRPNKEYGKKVLNYHKEIYEAIREKNLIVAQKKLEDHILNVNRKLPKFKKIDKKIFQNVTE
jgi:GntR family transcriptional repressor for pyruvate dehydrogenase complex